MVRCLIEATLERSKASGVYVQAYGVGAVIGKEVGWGNDDDEFLEENHMRAA